MVMHETTAYNTAVALCSVQSGRVEEHKVFPQGFDTMLQYFLAVLVSYVLV